MLLTAYFDESGTQPPAKYISVAGYVSTRERWEEFECAWRTALADFEIDYFHMVDFAHRVGQFQHWTEAERQQRFSRLADVIKLSTLGSVATSFAHSDYAAVFPPQADRFVGGPYGLAAVMCFTALGEILRLIGFYGEVEYVYESGAVGTESVRRTFRENHNDPFRRHYSRLGSIEFADKRLKVPLQAADILAYEWHLQLPRTRKQNELPIRQTLKRLAGQPHEWASITRGELEKWARIIALRSSLAPDQLQPPSPAPDSGRMLAISEFEFQERWKWWHSFKGSDLEL